MERRRRSGRQGTVRIEGPCKARRNSRGRRQPLGIPTNVTVHVTPRRGFRTHRNGLRHRSALPSKELGAQPSNKWTREDYVRTASCTPCRWNASRPSSTRAQGHRWPHRRLAEHRLDVFPPSVHQAPSSSQAVTCLSRSPPFSAKSGSSRHNRIGWFRVVASRALCRQSLVVKSPRTILSETCCSN